METAPASRGYPALFVFNTYDAALIVYRYTGGFGSALMSKDLGLAVEAAKSSGIPLPLGGLAHQLYAFMVSQGHGGKDFSAFFEFLQTPQHPKK